MLEIQEWDAGDDGKKEEAKGKEKDLKVSIFIFVWGTE